MNSLTMLLAALVIVPAVGLVVWAWFDMAQIEEELRSFIRTDGLYFDI